MATRLLARIISGEEQSCNILVQDNEQLSGGHVIKSFLCQMVCIYKTCHVFLSDSAKEAWSKGLPQSVLQKVQFHDCYSDPLGWTSCSSTLPAVHELNMSSSTPVIIDNVSSLVTRYHSYTELCRWLHQIGQQCPTVCSLLHADLHDDHVISALHQIMSSVIQVEPVKPVQYPTSRCCSTGSCILTHRRKSGKLIKKTELYLISEGYSLTSWAPPTQHTEEELACSKVLDPAANLTFDLTLTHQQQVDRAHVVLPYTRQATGSGGRVYYEPDEVDDIDESDPDDDLDV